MRFVYCRVMNSLFMMFPVVGCLAMTSLAGYANAQTVTHIAFGSCVHQDRPQPIWEQVLAASPDVFVFLGDNIYGDSDDPAVLQSRYDQLGQIEGFQRLRDQAQVVAIWDDHDYGQNDAGLEYVSKEASRQIMLDFWEEPADSLRRTRDDGIYTSYTFGDGDQRVQLILLDLRWNRSSLVSVNDSAQAAARAAADMGPYEVSLAAGATMLGQAQWEWFERQLQEPADLRIIGSSIQLLADFTGWESWANFPADRLRFFEALQSAPQVPTMIISGDTHWSEVSRIDEVGLPWPLVEVTSSGLTEEWYAISPNRHRVGEAFAQANFGLLTIDWSGDEPQVNVQIRDVEGQAIINQQVVF